MASPAFRFNYLTTEHDRKLVVQAVRKLRDHMAQPSVARRIKDETGEQMDLDSDADILAWASGVAQSNYHPSCTLRMGQGEQSAVDAAGRVHELDNVRVIDASVFPTIPTANLNAHTIMLAENALRV